MRIRLKQKKGFTLVELIIVIAIFSIIFTSSTLVFGNTIQRNSLRYNSYQLVQNMRELRTNSISQKGDSSWGVYFQNSSSPYGYTMFRGSSYASRDASYDLDFEFPEVLSFQQLSLGGSNEIVFDQSSGRTSNSGSLSISADSEVYSITVNQLGIVDYQF